MKVSEHKYSELLKNIGSTIETGRSNALSVLNEQILLTYWEIGRHIVELEQHGSERAEYGTALINNLSEDLKLRHGKGFSRSNIQLMRLFYIKYPKYQTSGKLTWSHYSELPGVSDGLGRTFYEQQGAKENWSVRELKRQIVQPCFNDLP